MNPTQKLELITRRISEIIDLDAIRSLAELETPINIYWGTAPTGKPHLGYLIPLLKIRDFLNAGCQVKILLADLHAKLDNLKSSVKLITDRTDYYELILTEILEYLGAPLDNLMFVRGSQFQLNSEYTFDMYSLTTRLTIDQIKRAGADVVKQNTDPLLSGVIYPILQCLDEEYLEADIQFGGIDQRKIFMLSRMIMPDLSYRKIAYLMNDLLPGLTADGKMSSSIDKSKIDFDDSSEKISNKILKAHSVDGVSESNVLLEIIKQIVFPLKNTSLTIMLDNESRTYVGIDDIVADFENGILLSIHLKNYLIQILGDIIGYFRTKINNEYKDLYERAYPTCGPVHKPIDNTASCLKLRLLRVNKTEIHKYDPKLTVCTLEEDYVSIVPTCLPIVCGTSVLTVCNLEPGKIKSVLVNSHIVVVNTQAQSQYLCSVDERDSSINVRTESENGTFTILDLVKMKKIEKIIQELEFDSDQHVIHKFKRLVTESGNFIIKQHFSLL